MKGCDNTQIFKDVRHEVKRKRYISLPCALSRDTLSQAAEHFFAFLSLPLDNKKQFYTEIDSTDPESMVGYMRRCKDGTCDEKEYFHYNRYAEDHFAPLVSQYGQPAQDFFASAGHIYKEAEQYAEKFLQGADQEFPGTYERFFPAGKKPHFYLRFLKYDALGMGEFLADGHYDQGAFTLALAESAPGLRIGSHDDDLEEIVHNDNEMIFMPALQLPSILDEDFAPAWHDVVQSSDDTYTTDAARWAIVFFVDPVVKEATTWEDRHTVI